MKEITLNVIRIGGNKKGGSIGVVFPSKAAENEGIHVGDRVIVTVVKFNEQPSTETAEQ